MATYYTNNELKYFEWNSESHPLSKSLAARQEFTFIPRRTAEDEAIDRHHTRTLGTFSAHSYLLGFVEALEAIHFRVQRISEDDDLKQILPRVIAHVKMGVADIQYERCSKVCLCVGYYSTDLDSWFAIRPKFRGLEIKGVLSGGRFNGRVIRYVAKYLRSTLNLRDGNCRYEEWGETIIYDTMFEITLERNVRLDWMRAERRRRAMLRRRRRQRRKMALFIRLCKEKQANERLAAQCVAQKEKLRAADGPAIAFNLLMAWAEESMAAAGDLN
ncbi:hypothetical protein Slin14017_G101210 [Septoria linicola]|nr:hypothetical protein Slin14017_G101210 [Septoria linicola]